MFTHGISRVVYSAFRPPLTTSFLSFDGVRRHFVLGYVLRVPRSFWAGCVACVFVKVDRRFLLLGSIWSFECACGLSGDCHTTGSGPRRSLPL